MMTDFYTMSITTKRKTKVSNGFGGHSETWATNLSFKGLIDKLSSTKQDITAQTTPRTTHVLLCEAGKDITIFDEVYYNSEKYRVESVDTPFGRHMEIMLEYLGVDNNA